jgi:hypothetical protein
LFYGTLLLVGWQVVVILTFNQENPNLHRSANLTMGKDFKKYTWFVGGTDVSAPLTDNADTFAKEPGLLTLMESFIGISSIVPVDRAETLRVRIIASTYC